MRPTHTYTVHHGGYTYFATADMARIFGERARSIAASGATELVPLLHRGGVELLVIGPQTPFAVVAIEVGAAVAVDAPEPRSTTGAP